VDGYQEIKNNEFQLTSFAIHAQGDASYHMFGFSWGGDEELGEAVVVLNEPDSDVTWGIIGEACDAEGAMIVIAQYLLKHPELVQAIL
jgi:hypothetical protein